MTHGENLRIAVVSSFEIAREGLIGLLHDQGFEANAVAALPAGQAALFPVDDRLVVLFDSSIEPDILASCRELRSRSCEIRIVVLCPGCTPDELQDAFAAGADAVLDKSITPRALGLMLRLVESGEKVMPSPLVGRICEMMQSGRTRDTLIRHANLSQAEADVLSCLVEGVSNKSIARRIGRDEQAVKDLVRTILRKLKLLNRTQAAIWALEAGLVRTRDGPAIRERRARFPGTAAAILSS